MKNRVIIALLVGITAVGMHAADWEYATNPWEPTRIEQKLAWKRQKLAQERSPYGSSNYTLEELAPIALGRKKFGNHYTYSGHAQPGSLTINKDALRQRHYAEEQLLRRNAYEQALQRKIYNLEHGYLGRFSNWISSNWYGTAR